MNETSAPAANTGADGPTSDHKIDGKPPANCAVSASLPVNFDLDQAAIHRAEHSPATKEPLRESVETSDASAHQLKARNAELLAVNEALRKSREDLHSVNDTLIAANVELKSTVELLSRSNTDLQNLMAATNIATIFLDRELRIQRFTPTATTLFNVLSGDLGRPLSGLSRLLDHPEIVADAERCLALLLPAQREVAFGEQWVLVRTFAHRTDDDQIAGVVLTFLDITAQKASENALRMSVDRFRAAVEAVGSLIWTNNAQGMMEGEQPGWAQFTGQDFASYQGYGWTRAVHPDDAQPTLDAWNRAVSEKSLFVFEHRVRRHDGQWRRCSIRAVPVFDAHGDISEWVGVHTDITDHQQAQEEIFRLAADSDRQRRLYETVLTNTPDFMYVFSLDHRVLYANDALIKMWGRGHEGAIGKTFLEVGYEPWHAEMHSREIDQVRATRQPIRGEVPFNGTNGRRMYDYIFVPVIGTHGEVEAVAGTTRDVTERKQDEERQKFLVTLADTIRPLSDPIAVQTEASRVLGEQLGARRVAYFEVVGDDFVVERDYTDQVLSIAGRYPIQSFGPNMLADLCAGRTASEHDVDALTSRTQDERQAFARLQICAYITVPLIKDGVFVAGLSVHVDSARTWTPADIAMAEQTAERTWAMVEKVRSELRVHESEQRFRLVADAAPVMIWISGVDKRCHWFNQPWLAFTGRPMAHEVGYGWAEGVHPDDVEACFQTYKTAFVARLPFSMEYRLRRQDGEFRWLIDNGVPRFGAGGEFDGYIGSCIDVTEYKHAEAKLRDADRRKDEFLATLAHELRNPLAPIRSGLQVIRMVGVDGTIEQARAMMERQLGQMTRLVDDLLDVSRVTTGKLVLRMERVQLQEVIAAALETSRPVIEQHGHELSVVLPDEPICVEADPIRLAQVVSNLLTNSAKYTPRGGHIRLAVSLEDRVDATDAAAVVTVVDDGIGIPPAMLESVFGMFTQVDRTLEKTTGGLGIGLSLVKGLVQMHGGTIQAFSEGEGKGSEFAVRLPVASPALSESAAEKVEAKSVEPMASHRILVVDDNVDAADSLGQLLELMGNEVRTVYDGASGIQAAAAFRPRVVLCDIGMPKMNGYDTARSIRAEEWGHSVVLVALTGYGQEDDLQKSANAGFDHHLVKPVDIDALMALLAGV